VTGREKMEGYCSTGQSPQRAVVPVEEEEEEEEFFIISVTRGYCYYSLRVPENLATPLHARIHTYIHMFNNAYLIYT
jgi:hypothetical protein